MAKQEDPTAGASTDEKVAEQLADVVPRLYRLLRTALDEEPGASSLEQLRVMQRIHEGLHNVTALAAARQMRMSAITSILDVLVERGWVTREADLTDRRRIRVELTPSGRRALRRGRQLTVRRMSAVLVHGALVPEVGVAMNALVEAVDVYDRGRELVAG